MINRTFSRELASLESVFDFLQEFFRQQVVDEKCRFAVQLAVEEVFTNLVKYNSTSTSDIILQAEREEEQIVIRIEDEEVYSFDITKPPPVDTQAPLEKRRPGGLGLFLVHQVMDQVDYHRDHATSIITLIKKIK